MRIQEFNYAENMDILPSILWQYEHATNIVSIIQRKQLWLDSNHSSFWIQWYGNIFNLSTINPSLFQVSLWCIILNIPLYVPLSPESSEKPNWGFNAFDPTYPDLENTYLNFGTTLIDNPGSGNFSTQGQFFSLTVAEQQFLLRLRYFQLCNLGDIYDINTFLNYLCATSNIGFTGTIYIIDNLNMTVSYIFTTDDFPSSLFSVITDLDVWPRPVTVAITT